jgi:hypothetical protein
MNSNLTFELHIDIHYPLSLPAGIQTLAFKVQTAGIQAGIINYPLSINL